MVFMLAPDGTEKYLHRFGRISARTDGAQPEGALLLLDGVLYGATRVEGKSKAKCNCGTLFSISVGRSAARKTPQVPGQHQPGQGRNSFGLGSKLNKSVAV
jgi:hypothetical protein